MGENLQHIAMKEGKDKRREKQVKKEKKKRVNHAFINIDKKKSKPYQHTLKKYIHINRLILPTLHTYKKKTHPTPSPTKTPLTPIYTHDTPTNHKKGPT